MAVYSEFKVYGPYTRKDGRQHVVLIQHEVSGRIKTRKTVSYPKYLVEVYLNKYLNENETVDHIDGNFSNNAISNLRVIDRKLHSKSHTNKREEIIKTCVVCGKKFKTIDNWRITCGAKSCRGATAHLNGYNLGNSIIREKNLLTSNRSLIQEIVSVETANSGKSLVDNPEQDTNF